MKYLILGAGPAGLSFAYRLFQMGEMDFLILEKENEAGGLCRSKEIDNGPLDVGGGHFIDVKDQEVLEFLFDVMPREEWNLYNRNSQISIHGQFINSPIEANIWQLSIEKQIEYLKEIAIAGCNLGVSKPDKFIEWIYWKLGKKIAEDYMVPYNQKIFSENLNSLGTYWLEKLPNVSFEETLRSCLEKKAYGTQPGHAQFLYPKKYGSGEVWRRIADRISGHINYNTIVKHLDIQKHSVNGEYVAEKIICTIPWKEFREIKGIKYNFKIYDTPFIFYTSECDAYNLWSVKFFSDGALGVCNATHYNQRIYWVREPHKNLADDIQSKLFKYKEILPKENNDCHGCKQIGICRGKVYCDFGRCNPGYNIDLEEYVKEYIYQSNHNNLNLFDN